jgi:hypothetical protein
LAFLSTVCVLSPTFIDAEWIRAALLGDGVMALLGPLLPQAAREGHQGRLRSALAT